MSGLTSRMHHWLAISPGAADRLKLTALFAMLTDHINTLLLTHPRPELYALGRLAFPLFVLIWARNVMLRPERLQVRANRMWLWAVVTQPAFSLAFRGHDPWYALNILFVFAGATQLLAWHRLYGVAGILSGTMLLGLMDWLLEPASYGLSGLVLAISLVIFIHGHAPIERNIAGVISFIALAVLNSHGTGQAPVTVLSFAIIPTIILPAAAVSIVASQTYRDEKRFMPAPFFYLTYAGHLLILGLLRIV